MIKRIYVLLHDSHAEKFWTTFKSRLDTRITDNIIERYLLRPNNDNIDITAKLVIILSPDTTSDHFPEVSFPNEEIFVVLHPKGSATRWKESQYVQSALEQNGLWNLRQDSRCFISSEYYSSHLTTFLGGKSGFSWFLDWMFRHKFVIVGGGVISIVLIYFVYSFWKENNTMIQIKDATIHQQNEQIKTKDVTIHQQNEQIKVKDVTIDQQNEQIKTKDITIDQQNEQIKTKDVTIHQQNEQIETKDVTIHQQNEQIKVKDIEIMHQKDEYTRFSATWLGRFLIWTGWFSLSFNERIEKKKISIEKD